MQNQESGIDPIVECDDPNAIIGVINRLMPQLPKETRLRFNQLKLALLQEFGFEGLHEKTNGYRVSQILDTNADVNLPGLIESGKRDGIAYKLYDAPSQQPEYP
jgi:hypothetical protein